MTEEKEFGDAIKSLALKYPGSAIAARFVARSLKCKLTDVAAALMQMDTTDPAPVPGSVVNVILDRRRIAFSFPPDWDTVDD